MKGIDVSEHNGNINWDLVKNEIGFAILRLGWTGNHSNHTLDKQFERNYAECKRLGIPVGVYVYNYCNTEDTVRSGAEWTLKNLNNKTLELPVYIDMEDNTIRALGKEKLTNICIAFNSVIEESGRWAGVYANLDWFTNFLNKEEIKRRYTTWIAHYGVNIDKYKGQYDMLQYTSAGRINGIAGNVDLNEMYRDLITEINGKKEEPKPVLKSIDEIANEVINGAWGNGEERKRRLEEAGYNYQDVQNRVNEKLKANKPSPYYPAVKTNTVSIVDALNSIGVNSSFDNRKAIAIKNGVRNYTGTALQNKKLLDKLKAGKLKK